MAVPTRAYVGVVVFGLIVTLVLGLATLFAFTGLTFQGSKPLELQQVQFPFAVKLLSVCGLVLGVGITVGGWRALLRGARKDEAARRLPREKPAPPAPEVAPPPRRRDDAPPPGYQ
ncbi:MAG: hypothetical protein ACYDBQ_04090 [Thermoplasmatota archaeon]